MNTLNQLDTDHLILMEAYTEILPRVEDSLTKTGKSLMPNVAMMINWTQQHFDEMNG